MSDLYAIAMLFAWILLGVVIGMNIGYHDGYKRGRKSLEDLLEAKNRTISSYRDALKEAYTIIDLIDTINESKKLLNRTKI